MKPHKLVLAFCVTVLLYLATSCSTVRRVFGTENPAIASVTLKDASGQLRALVRYDGKKLLVVSDGTLAAEMFLKESGMPILGPETVGLGKALYKEKGEETWSGNALSDLLPVGAAELFRDGEAAALGLGFAAE